MCDSKPIYAYHLTFQHTDGRVETVEIDGVDAGHAYSEALDDADIWPGDAELISIVRGEPRGYTT